jgi:hypothetical protein
MRMFSEFSGEQAETAVPAFRAIAIGISFDFIL